MELNQIQQVFPPSARPTNDDFVLVFISLPSEAPQKQQRTIGGKGDTFKHVGTETVFPLKNKIAGTNTFPHKMLYRFFLKNIFVPVLTFL